MFKGIIILDFSKNMNQKDLIKKLNNGGYYDTQKGALINYLIESFSELYLSIVGLNTVMNIKIKKYVRCKLVRLPFVSSILISAIFYNLLTSIYIVLNRDSTRLIFVYSSTELYPYVGALIISKLLKLPIFLCIRNPPESLYHLKSYSLVRTKMTNLIEYTYFNFSNKIIHISKKSKELLRSNNKFYEKSIVMGSCANDTFFNFPTVYINKKELKFAYWGVVNISRGLDVVLKGFGKAREFNNQFDAKFFIFGDGDDLERLRRLSEGLNISNVIFKNYVESEELSKFLQEIPVAVIPIPPTEFFQYSSPLKIAEAITMELPIIASNIEPNHIVRDENLGILCNHDVDSYADAFLKFWGYNESVLNDFRSNCRKIKHLYNKTNIFKELKGAIEKEIL